MPLNVLQKDVSIERQDEKEVEPLIKQQNTGKQDTDQESLEEVMNDGSSAMTTGMNIFTIAWKVILPISYILFIGLFPLTYHEYMNLDPPPKPEGLESTTYFFLTNSRLCLQFYYCLQKLGLAAHTI